MIIWDDKSKSHIIRIFGVQKFVLDRSKFNLTRTTEQNQIDIKIVIDSVIGSDSYHGYIKILSLSPFNYGLWIGPISMEPIPGWLV